MKKENDFFKQVWEVVKLIPEGRVTSYGSIANYLGAKRSARVVGWAMNASHSSSSQIPAHRVVNRNGLLSGKNFFSSPFEMQERLEAEGVMIKEDKIENFRSHFWDPMEELKIE